MAVDISPVIALISQRIVLAPGQIEPPTPIGRGTATKRYREGLISAQQFAAEMSSLGYSQTDIDRATTVAVLERDYDVWADKLAAVQEAFQKDILSYDQMRAQVLQLVPDQSKALVLVELYDFRRRPSPKPVTPERAPTLTVAQLLASWRAGVLPETDLRSELAERNYAPEDIDLLIATEQAKLPKPTVARVKQLSLAELRAMLAAGIISPDEFAQALLDRDYSPDDAQRLLGLEQIKLLARQSI